MGHAYRAGSGGDQSKSCGEPCGKDMAVGALSSIVE
jgi:hypothetical protein